MQHLSEEQLVAFHYRDLDVPDAAEHLHGCTRCTSEYEIIRRVLSLVSDAPVPERGDQYGQEVWTRLRWKLGAPGRRRWQRLVGVAAMVAVAFLAGHLWRGTQIGQRDTVPAATPGPISVVNAPGSDATQRLLLSVVSDHLDTSGRVLLEIANASAGDALATKSKRAEDLVNANRIYRQTARQHGDARIADLLAELEPILLELSNAGTSLEGKKLADLQKRIESRGLLFKVRVMSAADSGAPVVSAEYNNSL